MRKPEKGKVHDFPYWGKSWKVQFLAGINKTFGNSRMDKYSLHIRKISFNCCLLSVNAIYDWVSNFYAFEKVSIAF